MSPSDEHIREQAEAAVTDACACLSNVSGNFIIFARLDNGQYARKVTSASYADCVGLMSDVGLHLCTQVSRIAELMGEQMDLREFRKQDDDDHDEEGNLDRRP